MGRQGRPKFNLRHGRGRDRGPAPPESRNLARMFLRALVLLTFALGLMSPAAAQDRVTVGTQRLSDNGALFIAVARGYFKAEGLDVEMTAYKSDKEVAQAVASGATDFGLAAFTTDAFNYAGQGFLKCVAS